MTSACQPRRGPGRTALALVLWGLVAGGAATVGGEPPAIPPGLAVYREHCLRCHGENGVGTADVPAPLVGDRSVNQLAKYVHDTMPEDDPEAVTGEAARQVAVFMHTAF